MYYAPFSGSLWFCPKLTIASSAHPALELNSYCCSSQELHVWPADLLQKFLCCALFNLLNHPKNTAFTNLLEFPPVFHNLQNTVMQILKKKGQIRKLTACVTQQEFVSASALKAKPLTAAVE